MIQQRAPLIAERVPMRLNQVYVNRPQSTRNDLQPCCHLHSTYPGISVPPGKTKFVTNARKHLVILFHSNFVVAKILHGRTFNVGLGNKTACYQDCMRIVK